ncbi:NADP-dependent oxidoreductase [Salinicola aestuarinus]|uniref:NADP-dependent oxidoreductase n=1 Tax=Salinicola aestuarinus TaxID=1949082 RepID=UPI000DA1D6B8|nr:NADP-dependent oxidoreductase [Salinicola aestuarinus]
MKSVVIDEYGDNDVIQIADIDCPKPDSGEVLVKIHAAGVNPVDWKIRNGAGQRMGMTLPIHLGGEIAGTVAAIGEGVTGFFEGDAVFGIIGTGGFAEYARCNASLLARKPSTLDFVSSAALPLGALTAWQAMFDVAGLVEGQRLFITNGSGGVGSLAIQIAKARGVHVTAMASSKNEKYVRSLGADVFVDHTKQPFENVVANSDIVFDTVGGEVFQRAFKTVKKGGFVVTIVAFLDGEGEHDGIHSARATCKPNAAQLGSIVDLVEVGKLEPRIESVFPFMEVKAALEHLESGRASGKVVLQVND